MAIVDRVRELVGPLVDAESLELYDVEHHGGIVRVLVDDADGLDMAVITRLTRSISRMLDEHDPIPGRYTLEVSSPGLERPLRTADHFWRAVGAEVKVKMRPDYEGPRRISGVIVSAADDQVSIRADDEVFEIDRTDISSARTVFAWGPTPKPGGGSRPGKKRKREATSS